jgi:hypothetical protein
MAMISAMASMKADLDLGFAATRVLPPVFRGRGVA